MPAPVPDPLDLLYFPGPREWPSLRDLPYSSVYQDHIVRSDRAKKQGTPWGGGCPDCALCVCCNSAPSCTGRRFDAYPREHCGIVHETPQRAGMMRKAIKRAREREKAESANNDIT